MSLHKATLPGGTGIPSHLTVKSTWRSPTIIMFYHHLTNTAVALLCRLGNFTRFMETNLCLLRCEESRHSQPSVEEQGHSHSRINKVAVGTVTARLEAERHCRCLESEQLAQLPELLARRVEAFGFCYDPSLQRLFSSCSRFGPACLR